jgi:sorbitol/mannitol transport system substrate-binding protein
METIPSPDLCARRSPSARPARAFLRSLFPARPQASRRQAKEGSIPMQKRLSRAPLLASSLAAVFLAAPLLAAGAGSAEAATLTIATVNNPDMLIMQKLSPEFTKETGIGLNWVVLDENTLRERVTTDIATKSGTFDVVTIGTFETPQWGKNGWLDPIGDLGAAYDMNDIFPSVRAGLSYKGTLYAVPFYAESSMTYYRKDLFQAAGLTMPAQPTYDDIAKFADKLTDPAKGVYGICLRGLPGWGENMAFLTTVVNTFGGEWFNMKWEPQLTSAPWEKAISFYVDLMKRDGPPNATSNGFTENLALFSTGKCGMWIDATVAAGYLYDPSKSKVAADVAVAPAPVDVTPHGAHWLWSWALSIPSTSRHEADAKKFLAWATSKSYIDLVGTTDGWVAAPPGTRLSTYQNPNYLKAAPFAPLVEQSILTADPEHPTLNPVPYTGVQFVGIPEFQGIGTTVGQDIAAALAGQTSVSAALAKAQASATRSMTEAGYIQ